MAVPPAIAISNLTKTFSSEEGEKTALQSVNLRVEQGDIYGIMGLSGAGKSTLVRCINGLEHYDSGTVTVNSQEVGSLNRSDLRLLRRDIGMIFQSFNLMPSRTVAGNVELAFRDRKDKTTRESRVAELLDLVGLADKTHSYPSELSGGQKQRVAIARALVNNPSILLSDEATSALDPNTTQSILDLLRKLHDSLGLTIVVITHQMAVIKQICNKVAVIADGSIVEEGKVFDLFVNPQASLTKSFIETTSNLEKISSLIEHDSPLVALHPGEMLLRMQYVSKQVSFALISTISRQFNIDANIIFGDIDVVDNAPLGGLVVILKGEQADIREAITFLKNRDIRIEVLKHAELA
ncbi:methionine ABC transporter ATP-binding protein [Bifidobacterium aquikefiricola]|uniref:ATP-binding cassette domain-containing protein n=1 Tax=Bifidobacterium aquikefiricola TaxID=3059038 RepID=A0AB39U8I5_9BIFI